MSSEGGSFRIANRSAQFVGKSSAGFKDEQLPTNAHAEESYAAPRNNVIFEMNLTMETKWSDRVLLVPKRRCQDARRYRRRHLSLA
jgi:hypothetical protein